MDDRRDDTDRRDRDTGPERRMGDRRDSHRLPIDVEIKIGNEDYSKHQGNVGIGGVFFVKPLDLPTGAIVQLRFVLPEMEKQIEAKAEVVEITSVGLPSAVGTRVRFSDLDIRSELLLARYLDSHQGA